MAKRFRRRKSDLPVYKEGFPYFKKRGYKKVGREFTITEEDGSKRKAFYMRKIKEAY